MEKKAAEEEFERVQKENLELKVKLKRYQAEITRLGSDGSRLYEETIKDKNISLREFLDANKENVEKMKKTHGEIMNIARNVFPGRQFPITR